MKIDFVGKNILVTGGTRGIGAAIAQTFAQAGGNVTVTSTSQTSFDEFSHGRTNGQIHFMQADFSSLESTQALAKKIASQKFDVLINNAGINKVANLENIELEDWQRMQDVNLRAPFLLTQAVSTQMKKNKWGRIVNISSVFGVVTKEKRASYTASKAGLIGLTKTTALELSPYGILVNSVSPGFIDTELTRKNLGEQGIKEMVAKVPMGKLGLPQDIANLVIFLSSDLNGFITGENIVIDGGFTCA